MSPHGTNSRYVNARCRCDECRAAHTTALKANNDARRIAWRRLALEHPARFYELFDLAYYELTGSALRPAGRRRKA